MCVCVWWVDVVLFLSRLWMSYTAARAAACLITHTCVDGFMRRTCDDVRSRPIHNAFWRKKYSVV